MDKAKINQIGTELAEAVQNIMGAINLLKDEIDKDSSE
jgi:hypothetical protein